LSEEILKKEAKLTGEEVQMIREHPVRGAQMIQSFRSLRPIAPIILYSHENYDGSGYPSGLKGKEIPIGARILSVVNAFDALIAGRPYRMGTTAAEGLEELRKNKGSQFDPHVVDMFQRVVEKPRIWRLLHKGVHQPAS